MQSEGEQVPAGPKRQNTRLEAEGAEFLVLGSLLIEGIQCFKAYTNFAGYDLVAVEPLSGRSARIQVKSRWATDYDRSFAINNFDCDFVVLAALNLGIRFRKVVGKPEGQGRSAPQLYCFPVEVVRSARSPTDSWGKVSLSRIPDVNAYEDAWHLVRQHLDARIASTDGLAV